MHTYIRRSTYNTCFRRDTPFPFAPSPLFARRVCGVCEVSCRDDRVAAFPSLSDLWDPYRTRLCFDDAFCLRAVWSVYLNGDDDGGGDDGGDDGHARVPHAAERGDEPWISGHVLRL